MDVYICFLVLICSISCYCHDDKLEKKNFTNNEDFQRQGYLEKYYKSGNNDEEYVGNPDLDAEIERPCRVYDLNCIRKYFAEHSKCKIRRGPLPRNFIITQESLYFARVNLTLVNTNLRIGGFRNTRVEEFYINKRTNRMVFSINIRGLTTMTPSNYFVFYRNGREPIVIVAEAGLITPSVTFTAIFPNKHQLQIEKAEITAYNDAVPAFYIGPEVANNTDPTVTQSLVEFMADTSTDTQEFMLTDSQFYLPTYIQFNICDFGLTNL